MADASAGLENGPPTVVTRAEGQSRYSDGAVRERFLELANDLTVVRAE